MAVAVFGAFDALYLTIEHFRGVAPVCTIGGCDLVLTSQYSTLIGIPTSLLGVIFYLTTIALALSFIYSKNRIWLKLLLVLTTLGLFSSLGLTWLQIYVIEALCLYCLLSAGSSITLWIMATMLNLKR